MQIAKKRNFLNKETNFIDQVCIHPNTIIDTNFTFSSSDFQIETVFVPLTSNYAGMFGSYRGGLNFGCLIFCNYLLYDCLGTNRRIGLYGNPSSGLPHIPNQDNICVFDSVGYTLNGSLIKFANTTIPFMSSSYKLYVGCLLEDYGKCSFNSKFLLKSFKLWQNNILCLNIVPYKMHGTFYLYDKIASSILNTIYGSITHDFDD